MTVDALTQPKAAAAFPCFYSHAAMRLQMLSCLNFGWSIRILVLLMKGTLEVLSILMASALDKLNSKIFVEQLHTNFKVHLDNTTPLSLELTAVNEHEASPKMELFALLFLGPNTPRLKQQIHRFEHEKLGTFDLFLTAIGADAAGITYEVVFHRFRKENS